MPRALLALGANLGDRRATFAAALDALEERADAREIARSAWRETRAIGGGGAHIAFLNGACLVETALEPHALWERMLEIEARLGRQRNEPWGPRTLDLDLLLYDQEVIADRTLTVPHPRLALRRFVLEPAAEIAAAMSHPLLGVTIGEIWEHVRTTAPTAVIQGGTSDEQRQLLARLEAALAAWPAARETWRVGMAPVEARPRIVIELTSRLEHASDKLPAAEARWAQGLVLAVDLHDLDLAAREAACAIEGLADEAS